MPTSNRKLWRPRGRHAVDRHHAVAHPLRRRYRHHQQLIQLLSSARAVSGTRNYRGQASFCRLTRKADGRDGHCNQSTVNQRGQPLRARWSIRSCLPCLPPTTDRWPNPRPVPPNRRVVVLSAWEETPGTGEHARPHRSSDSGVLDLNRTVRTSFSDARADALITMRARSVNLTALPTRLSRT